MSHILIADDEPAFLRLAASWLQGQGHRVSTAGDGTATVAAFERERPEMVLLDLAMPPHYRPEAGLDLLPRLRGVPVVVITGHADHALALRAIEAGAWDFLAKPLDPDLLRMVVGRALEKAALERELRALRAGDGDDFGLIGASAATQRLREMIRRLAPTEISVIVHGSSGTGKELVARALHGAGSRRDRPFVAVHCGAIPADLLESELFGHLKGSFTGAHADRPGLIESAQGGTLFLDEIGEMPPAMQVKLLRVLQDGSYLPVGGRTPRHADLRVVAATHRDLEAMVGEGRFREDLYYRLKGLVLRIPALAERPEDIPVLAAVFLRRAAPALRLMPDAAAWLMDRPWPGNVRELQSLIRTAAALADAASGVVGAADLAFAASGEVAPPAPVANGTLDAQLAALEDRLIRAALAECAGNHSRAARRLGISRMGLLNKMRRMGLR